LTLVTTALPSADGLLRSFAGAAGADVPLTVAARLAEHHRAQWDAEDLCRSPVGDEQLGRLKRRIDRLKGQRVALVDELDRWMATVAQNRDGVCHTETFGTIVDRLAIAWVRVRMLTADPAARDVAAAAVRQLDELAAAYDTLVAEVHARRRALPLWRALKFYRQAAPAAGR
jgi:hypothetical protein